MNTSFCQDNREEIQQEMVNAIVGHTNIFEANFQLRTLNIVSGREVCRRIKQKFARIVHKRRKAKFPYFGSLEVKGHLHCHILTTIPNAMEELDLLARMDSVIKKTKGLYPDYHKFKMSDDPQGWIEYITKFEDPKDEVIWVE